MLPMRWLKLQLKQGKRSCSGKSLLNNKYKPTTGEEVTFNKAHEEGTLIKLNWENGYVIQHEVDFNAINDNNMHITFVVSAEKINYGGSSYDGIWPEIKKKHQTVEIISFKSVIFHKI